MAGGKVPDPKPPLARRVLGELASRAGTAAVALVVARVTGVKGTTPTRPATLARKVAVGTAVGVGRKVVLPAVAVVGAALALRRFQQRRADKAEQEG